MSGKDVLKMIKENEVKWVDLRFTDTRGKEQHVTIPAHTVEESFFEDGQMFDGSSIAGWKGINESDMVLMPDTASAYVDPFFGQSTLAVNCDILEPSTYQPYNRDPRTTAKKAEAAAAAAEAASDKVWSKDELMAKGQTLYDSKCAACHQPTGLGLPPAFPALKGSPIAAGPIAGGRREHDEGHGGQEGRPGSPALQPFFSRIMSRVKARV